MAIASILFLVVSDT